ncbi:MAG: TonB-dependent receptor [Bacteroidota bacterium]|nr:TonB-dependent receptor [Bacteroidota bacterium]
MRKSITLFILLMLTGAFAFSQNRTISGVVVDGLGNSIPNVSVLARGTTLGTATNENGSFKLSVPSSSKSLIFSGVGYTSQELRIGGSDSYRIQLAAADNTMQEVVIVAYGSQKKTDLTGSVATIKPKDIENKPFTSVDKALQGQVAGLLSSSVSGAPGSATAIRIRGVGSLNASAGPLWVIDGNIATTGDLTSNTTTSNALSSINPDDIESITVLKDAAAASIYGSRAANGVILVTTKKGKSGKTKINFSAELGQNSPTPINENNRSLTTSEYQEVLRDAVINAGYATTVAEADALIVDPVNGFGLKPDVNTNWLDMVTQNGNQSQYNLSLSGGSEKTTFYASAGYFKQLGTVIASNFDRYSGALNITHHASDRLTFNAGISGSSSKQRTPNNGGAFANPVLGSYFLLPWYSPYFPDGSFKYDDSDNEFPVNGGLYNPLIQAAWNKNSAIQTTFRGNVVGEYEILDNLKITSRFSGEYFDVQEDSYRNPFYGDGVAAGGDGFASYKKIFNWTWSSFADYRKYLARSNDVYFDLKAGYEAQHYKQYLLQAGAQGFPGTLDLNYLTSAATPTTASSVPSDYSTNSIFSSAVVNFKDRYVVSGSFRRDGSSVFGAQHRFGNFYSAGATWNINEEAFLKNSKLFNLLKLRASYGENGNALGFGFYSSLATYGYGSNYTGLPGSRPSNVGNDQLTWEKNNVLNLGLDFGLFRNRISGTVEVYDRKTTGLLAPVPLSRTSGFSTQTQNIGAVSNKGVEVTLNGRPINSKDFTWDVSFNFAHNKNKITALYNNRPVASGFFNYTVGYDIQTFYLRQWAGVDPANGDPLWYLDSSHSATATTNSYSKAPLMLNKSAAPKYFGSFTNTFNYKGFELQAQFVYNFGNYIYDTWDRYLNSDGLYYGSFNQSNQQLKRWQKPGDITNVPKIIYGGNKNSYNTSTRYLYNGDYIRLRNLQLGYTFSKEQAQKLRLNNFSFYVRGTNLFVFDKDKNLPFDPEAGINSTTNFDVFIPRTFTVGFNIGL